MNVGEILHESDWSMAVSVGLSDKMSKFYDISSKLLTKILSQNASIKNAILSSPDISDKKRCMALICHTLEYKSCLEQIIENSGIIEKEKNISKSLMLLLLHDFLFGGGVKCGGPYKVMMNKHKTRLNGELVKLKVKRGVKRNEDLKSDLVKAQLTQSVLIPRHVRVNTLKITVNQAIDHFRSRGFRLIEGYETLKKNEFKRDEHLSQLLVFPQGTDFHEDPLYKAGAIILQEKSSCFPAIALGPTKNAYAIDACAAPGNKTTFISALMENTGKCFAFDMDPRRLKLLRKNVDKAGCINVETMNRNFLEIDPSSLEYEQVEYILLDPSCSGSGIVSRMDSLVNDDEHKVDQDRLFQLAAFQKSVILHAFKFPRVKRIVYSTCSVEAIENEQVVMDVLNETPDFDVVKILPFWKRRGILISDDELGRKIQECVVRCLPKDHTNGFFVSCFERR